MASLMPTGKQQYFNPSTGKPLAGGQLFTYAAGTSTPKTTWQDAAGTVPNTNPITLDSTGSALVYWDGSYKIAVKDALGNTIYTVDQYNTDPYGLLRLFTSIGSSLVGFIQAGAGAVARWVQDKLREQVSVLDFMTAAQRADVTSGTGAVDVTAAVQAALDYVGGLSGGGRLYAPAGVYLVSATLNIKANTYLYGDGWSATQFNCAHTGDGIRSSFTINSSTAANINIKDLGVTTTNAGNTGGGYVDVGGTYLNVENCQFSGFNYGVILDQSELAVVDRNNFSGNKIAQLWLANGGHTPGTNLGFTNRISITNNQFNGANTVDSVRDDGGNNHIYTGNNFNGGAIQMKIASVALLTIKNNEMEASASFPIYLTDTTSVGTYVGGVQGFSITDNQIGTGSSNTPALRGAYNIYIDEAYAGEIKNNLMYRATTAALEFNYGSNYRISGIAVSGNMTFNKISGFAATPTPMVTAAHFDIWRAQGDWNQQTTTYCTAGFAAGFQQITPANMVGIYDGARLRVVNSDGTNPETVIASQLSATQLFCTFALAKSPGFRIFVEDGNYSGTYTPAVTGSGPTGGSTTTVAYGSFTKIGNRCFFQANVTWTALTGGAAGQMKLSLPFPAKTDANDQPAIACLLTGPGAISLGAPFLIPASGVAAAGLVAVNQTTGALSGPAVPASGSIYVSGNYEI